MRPRAPASSPTEEKKLNPESTNNKDDSKATSSSSILKSKTPTDYRLYWLPDNSPASLEKIKNIADAVLLYPDPADKSGSESRQYKACVIQNGSLQIDVQSKSAIEVSMGSLIISTADALPCDITTTQPNAVNLINSARARANINLTPIFKTPLEVFTIHQAPKMNDASLAAFARTSLYAHEEAQPELEQRAIKKLFSHILNGEPEEVKKMLDTNPRLSLLSYKASDRKEEIITNKARQHILVQGKTAYQLALGEDDTEIMAMFKASIIQVTDENEANAQYNAQFKEGWEKEEKERWAPAFAKLDELTQAIRHAQPDDIKSSDHPDYKLELREESNVNKALLQFRSSLDAILNEVVTTGRHFNPDLFSQALKIYEKNFKDYFGDNWSNPRAMLFWQRTIGYIERVFPANYVQAACDGFYNTEVKLRKWTPQGRLFKFKVFDLERCEWIRADFYPLSTSRLGFDFALATRDGHVQGRGLAHLGTSDFFGAYVNQKRQPYKTYLAPRQLI